MRLGFLSLALALFAAFGLFILKDQVQRREDQLHGLQVAIADSKAELMRWSLVFWVGAVGAIAALAGVLR